MAKKSLFGRLANVFKEEEEDSSEDIDKDVEAAVMATLSAEVEGIDGNTVVSASQGKQGETVHIFDLAPIFDLMGGRDGRVASGLLEICQRQFDASRESPRDNAVIEGDLFIMRFDKCSNEEGFRRAALLINEVGTQVLMDRFQKVDVPEILVTADVDDITDDDGAVDMSKIAQVQKQGGIPIALDLLDGVPNWAKMAARKMADRFVGTSKDRKVKDIDGVMSEERVIKDQVVVESRDREEFNPDHHMVEIKRERKQEEIRMVEIKPERKKNDDIQMVPITPDKKGSTPDWMDAAMKPNAVEEPKKRVKRSGIDRRQRRIPVGAKNRRTGGMERRGRGF
jgi:hypothetical protein